ncbi:nucleoside hydrolase-like domain-containing protein [Verrucomicrobiaceae bacterium 227]
MNKRISPSLPWLKLNRAISILTLNLAFTGAALAADKPRLVVLTDISPNKVEPDDMESIIRLFVHADLFEIEGLIHSTGWSAGTAREDYYQLIHETIDLYEKDLPNLRKRSDQNDHAHDGGRQQLGYWPSPDYLRERSMMGSKHRGQKFIGKDNNSPGSDMIIKLADEDDDRPLWVTVWGGGNTLAQAIWKVQETRSEEELKAFLKKLRVYTITDQDGKQKSGNVIDWKESSHYWMRQEFEKDLHFIWDESAWKHQNGTGRKNWNEYATHVQGHGNLGKRYPKYKYGVEGDTPAFLHLLPNGLNDPDVPGQVGWGGYFEFGKCKDGATKAHQNHGGSAAKTSSKYQRYFYPATFRNFAARMDWAKDGKGNRNPIAIIDNDDGLSVLEQSPKQGDTIALDASKSRDPDGDELTFKWWILPEAGSYEGKIEIMDGHSNRATLKVPAGSAGKTIHVICEVTDNGTHELSAYRRIILTPTK